MERSTRIFSNQVLSKQLLWDVVFFFLVCYGVFFTFRACGGVFSVDIQQSWKPFCFDIYIYIFPLRRMPCFVILHHLLMQFLLLTKKKKKKGKNLHHILVRFSCHPVIS